MRERPILFSGPMVRAILEGRKTQTRRVLMPQPVVERIESFGPSWAWRKDEKHWFSGVTEKQLRAPYGLVASCPSPYQVGVRLWVRETWGRCDRDQVIYRADNIETLAKERQWVTMRAARLNLEVAAVHAERVQEITEADALAEGIAPTEANTFEIEDTEFQDARSAYAYLWQGINGKRAPWESNPWVWVVSFKRLENLT